MDKSLKANYDHIGAGLKKVETAIDTLVDFKVDQTIYALISERVFMGTDQYGAIDNKSDFLKGAFFAFKELSILPEMLTEILRGKV